MSCNTKTPYAGAEGMLPQMKGNLTIRNEKSARLPYIIWSIVFLNHRSLSVSQDIRLTSVSVVFFFSSSLGEDAIYRIPETRIV